MASKKTTAVFSNEIFVDLVGISAVAMDSQKIVASEIQMAEPLLATPLANTAPVWSSFQGVVTTDFGSSDSNGFALAVQADGKLLVAGDADKISRGYDFALARYNPNGTLDTSFGTGGKVTTDITGFDDSAQALAVLADGKLLAAGFAYNGSNYNFALARYNANGSLDTSFGTGGKVTTDFPGGSGQGSSVAVQADGKLVVAGSSSVSGIQKFALARYNSNGSLDTSFGSGGKVTTDFGGADLGSSSTMQSDGKILVAGMSIFNDSNFALARYNPNGSLDTGFGSGGKVITDFSGNFDYGNAVTVQTDGKILVAGGSNGNFALARYNSSGSLDTGFGSGGKVTTNFAGSNASARDLTVQADGKLVVAGDAVNADGSHNFALARYNTNGALDTSFGTGGKVVTALSANGGFAYALSIQADGLIAVTGSSNGDFALVRYNPDGSLATAKTPAYVENNAAVKLDNYLQLNDAELDSANNYGGLTVSVARQGGASADDGFTFDTAGAVFTLSGSSLLANGQVFGNFTTSNGTLTLHFTSLGTPATSKLVNDVLQHLTYRNTAGVLPSQVKLDWSANDGNNGAQGSGSALSSIYTSTVTMVSVNDAPVGTNKTVSTTSNTAYTVTVSDFGFTDPNDSPANAFSKVIISQLPTAGGLTLAGNAVALNQAITVADISAGLLKFTPATGGSGAAYAQIGFKVQDNGGTANGGVDIDTVTRFLTANVLGNNTAPMWSSFQGKVTTDFGGNDEGYTMAVQADGKLVVAGNSYLGGNYNFALVRYNLNGSLDLSFGSGGKITTDFSSSDDQGRSVSVQADGKLVVAGFANIGGNYNFALARYNPNGTLDTTFGTGGKVTTDFGGLSDGAAAVTIQADGKLVVAGYTDAGGLYTFALARYNANGSLDTSFGSGGKVTTGFGGNDQGFSIIGQSDGKFLVVGMNAFNDSNFALARYNTNGSLDTTFGTGGKVITDFSGNLDYGYAVTVQTDGKILVAGDSNGDFALARYNSNGSLDTSFGGGKVITDFSGYTDSGTSITMQADGKLLVAGYSSVNAFGSSNFALARYNANGSLDLSFGSGGKVVTDLGSSNDRVWSVIIQADGLIAVAGSGGSNSDFALVRYNPDGSLATAKTPAYVENSAAVKLDDYLQLNDAELDSANNYGGLTVTVARQGGASADDGFAFDTAGAIFTLSGSSLLANGQVFGNFTTSNGTLTLRFTSLSTPATSKLVNDVLEHITYRNTADVLPSQVKLDWTANDGNSGAQGSGVALSSVYTSTVTIVSVNDAPIGTDKTVSTASNTAYTVTVSDFGFTDPNDSPANAFSKVIISQLPTAGGLTLAGNAVALNQAITVADISAGLLKFTPATGGSGAAYAKIGFKVQDDGGTANGGVDTGTVTRFLTVNVGASNHAPTGAVFIDGFTTQDQVLTASNTLVDADGLGAVTYTWKSGSTVLGTGATYTLKASDVETTVTVTASYTDNGGTMESVTSAATAVVGIALTGTTSANTLLGTIGRDSLRGGAGNDVLAGDLGDDLLDGGTGADSLVGGAGDDIYVVDNKADVVAEIKNGGFDTILASINLTLAANVENLTLTGTTALKGTGNDLSNSIVGNIGNNTLDGGIGMDTLFGGLGNDTFILNDSQDSVVESFNEGIDTINTSVSLAFLANNVENLTLTGTTALKGTGNDLSNSIVGNHGNNTLDGGIGMDTLFGGLGNDTFILNDSQDSVVESFNQGIDTIITSLSLAFLANNVENLTLTGGAADGTGNDLNNIILGNNGNNTLVGGAGNDVLDGGAGADTLDGGQGRDKLTGGDGMDIFMFADMLTETWLVGNVDSLTDFSVGFDIIQLENDNFSALTRGVMDAGFLKIGKAAADADDFIIYNPVNGALAYDADGNGVGAAVLIALLGKTLALTSADFIVA